MSRIRQTKGFTLVELLVVISIIALLIGILIPAIAQARTAARMSVDLASLRQHGIGSAAYAGDNKNNMPNGQPGSGGGAGGLAGFTDGSKNRPQRGFFSQQFPTNGISFNGDALMHGNIWKLHNMIFGDYIVDGATGLDLLNPIFLSAGNSGRRQTWEDLRSARPGDPDLPIFPTGYTTSGSGADTLDSFIVGTLPEEFNEAGNVGYLAGSWRYTLTAVVGNSELDGEYFWGKSEGSAIGNNTSSAWTQPSRWVNYRAYIKQSSFTYPSDKVTFWDPAATNSHGSYVEDGAKVPVVMVEGSARVSEPVRECLDPTNSDDSRKISDAYLGGDYVSTNFLWSGLPSGEITFVGRPQRASQPAWFMTGIRGASTRDFGGKSLN